MSALKKKKVVIIESEKPSSLYIDSRNGILYFNIKELLMGKGRNTPIFLHFLSDEPLSVGDYALSGLIPYQVTNDNLKSNDPKIVATTDYDIPLPKPSPEFIIKFLGKFNMGERIFEVMIQYTYDAIRRSVMDVPRTNYRPKVDKNNYITIKPIKDTYTRKEVEGLLKTLMKADFIDFAKGENAISGWKKYDLFIEENL